jgi:hypothetical protein
MREPDNPDRHLPPLPDATAERRAELHAITRVRPFGIGDNPQNYQIWFEESDVYRKIIFETVDIAPFVGHVNMDPRAAAAIIYFVATLPQRTDNAASDVSFNERPNCPLSRTKTVRTQH